MEGVQPSQRLQKDMNTKCISVCLEQLTVVGRRNWIKETADEQYRVLDLGQEMVHTVCVQLHNESHIVYNMAC